MKQKFIFKLSALLLSIVILFSSCASTTMINSIPSGAKVYINDEFVGETPYKHTDTSVVGKTINVELRKDNYEPFYTSFTRTEQVNPGAIIGGIFFFIPYFWAMDYKPTHNYELVPLPNFKAQTSNNQAISITKSKADRLKELKELYDEKLITEEEYNKAKNEIIND